MVRFGKNGSDATAAAVRLARAITGRDLVLQCGYHGWQDWCMAHKWRNKGIPEDTKNLVFPFKYNKFPRTVKEDEAACVIMEPVTFEEPDMNYLMNIRKWCDATGALLIFDEMITGFRWSIGGAQTHFNVIPDLACFGKAMANGWPISAVVGKKEYMEHFKDIHFSTTFGGEVLSIQAAHATIRFMQQNPVIEHLWGEGDYLISDLKRLIEKHKLNDLVEIEGYPVWPRLKTSDHLVKSFISQELIARGVLWLGTINLSYAHKRRHIDLVLKAFDEVFESLGKFLALEKLDYGLVLEKQIKGEPIKARQVRP
jgi:glutamate-1-semialdehyde aminotransferase